MGNKICQLTLSYNDKYISKHSASTVPFTQNTTKLLLWKATEGGMLAIPWFLNFYHFMPIFLRKIQTFLLMINQVTAPNDLHHFTTSGIFCLFHILEFNDFLGGKYLTWKLTFANSGFPSAQGAVSSWQTLRP